MFFYEIQIFFFQLKQYVMMYIKPQYRAAPYIIGLLLGYHLVKIQANELYYKRHSATFVACGWILAIFSAFISVYGLYPVLIVSFQVFLCI